MRKEISGLILFFLVILSLISLLSYSPADPSIHTAAGSGKIHNLFGLLGAHFSGFLIGLFGLGAFWIPVIFLLSSIHILGNHPRKALVLAIGGGLLLTVSTGALLSIRQHHYSLFGSQFSAGGLIGIPLKNVILASANTTGGTTILTLLWIIGFILATGFSIQAFLKRCHQVSMGIMERVNTLRLKYQERRKKIQRRRKTQKEAATSPAHKLEIKTPTVKPAPKAPIARQEVFDFMRSGKGFQLPPTSFLEDPEESPIKADNENLRMQSKLLEKKLQDFGVAGKVVAVTPGPVITTFEYEPAPGVKINKVVNLTDDLALTLRAMSIQNRGTHSRKSRHRDRNSQRKSPSGSF